MGVPADYLSKDVGLLEVQVTEGREGRRLRKSLMHTHRKQRIRTHPSSKSLPQFKVIKTQQDSHKEKVKKTLYYLNPQVRLINTK